MSFFFIYQVSPHESIYRNPQGFSQSSLGLASALGKFMSLVCVMGQYVYSSG